MDFDVTPEEEEFRAEVQAFIRRIAATTRSTDGWLAASFTPSAPLATSKPGRRRASSRAAVASWTAINSGRSARA